MGVMTSINNLIPPEWDYVLRKNKVLTVYKQYLYDNYVPYKLRNKKGYKEAIRIIKLRLSRGIVMSIDAYNTKEGHDFWFKIEKEINEYIEQCR